MKELIQNTLEATANYEGDHTLLLYKRLKNRKILDKIVKTTKMYQESQKEIKEYGFDPEKQELVEIENSYASKVQTEEEIRRELLGKIEKVFSATNISVGEDSSARFDGEYGSVAIFSLNPDTGLRWSKKQLNLIESHEKGHEIRNFFVPGESFKKEIQSALDFSKVEIPEVLMKRKEKEMDPELKQSLGSGLATFLKNEVIEYFMSIHEIIERMSQLKNYFGIEGDGKFTKAHLIYAKKHYISDTGMGSQIKPFLDSITKDREEKFLELINSLGI